MRFEKGECYFATPCLEGARKILVTVVGRSAGSVMFSATEPLETEWVKTFDGREIARVRRGGMDYTVSPAAQVDAVLAHDIAAAIVIPRGPGKPSRSARRGIFSKMGVPIC